MCMRGGEGHVCMRGGEGRVCMWGWGGVRWNCVGRCGPNLWIIMIVPTKSTRFHTDNFQRI